MRTKSLLSLAAASIFVSCGKTNDPNLAATKARLAQVEAELAKVKAIESDKPSKELSTAKAQKAFDKMKKGVAGTAVVNGVRSYFGADNYIAEATLTNFGYTDNNQAKVYSGHAEALFQRYTDGRWILKWMQFGQAKGSGESFTFNIEVP